MNVDRLEPDERIDGNSHQEAEEWLRNEADTRLLKRLANGRNKSANLPKAAALWGHRRVSNKAGIAVLAREELDRRAEEILKELPTSTLEKIAAGNEAWIPSELKPLDPERVAEIAAEILEVQRRRNRRRAAATDGGREQYQQQTGSINPVAVLVIAIILFFLFMGGESNVRGD